MRLFQASKDDWIVRFHLQDVDGSTYVKKIGCNKHLTEELAIRAADHRVRTHRMVAAGTAPKILDIEARRRWEWSACQIAAP